MLHVVISYTLLVTGIGFVITGTALILAEFARAVLRARRQHRLNRRDLRRAAERHAGEG